MKDVIESQGRFHIDDMPPRQGDMPPIGNTGGESLKVGRRTDWIIVPCELAPVSTGHLGIAMEA